MHGGSGGGKSAGFKLSLRNGAACCGTLCGRNWRLGDRALRPPFQLGLHDAVFGRQVFVPLPNLLVHSSRHAGQDERPIHNRPLPCPDPGDGVGVGGRLKIVPGHRTNR